MWISWQHIFEKSLYPWLYPWLNGTVIAFFLGQQVFAVEGAIGLGVGTFIPEPSDLCEVLSGTYYLIPSNATCSLLC